MFHPFKGGDHEAAIPLGVLHHALRTRTVGRLRTFIALKYTQAADNGRVELDPRAVADLLDVTPQTVRDHVRALCGAGWLNYAGGKAYYVRGWKRVIARLDKTEREHIYYHGKNRAYVVVRTTLRVIGSKRQFKAFALYTATYTNAAQQTHHERKKRKGTIALREAVLPRLEISCKTVAGWFGVSERIGSVYRRIMADYGFFGMVRRWFSLPDNPHLLRLFEEAGRILWRLPSGEIWSPRCSVLHGLDTDSVVAVTRYAK